MRLIDADKMDEELFYKEMSGKDTLITCETAFNMIKEQPTAYDVENVVEQLQNMSNGIPLQYEYNYEQGVSDGLDKAIEIVKQGGIETNNVCEWQKYDYKTICSPHERDWSIPAMKDFKYCPHCGKKIKAVHSNDE